MLIIVIKNAELGVFWGCSDVGAFGPMVNTQTRTPLLAQALPHWTVRAVACRPAICAGDKSRARATRNAHGYHSVTGIVDK
jgi:hypothetical protein